MLSFSRLQGESRYTEQIVGDRASLFRELEKRELEGMVILGDIR